MAPKAIDGVSVDAANFRFIFAVVKNNKSTIEPAWDDVAKECGISYGRNAASKFKDLVKKHGCRLDAGKIVIVDECSPAQIATPKKATEGESKKVKTPASSSKKRKITVEEDSDALDDEQDTKGAIQKDVKEEDSDDTDEAIMEAAGLAHKMPQSIALKQHADSAFR